MINKQTIADRILEAISKADTLAIIASIGTAASKKAAVQASRVGWKMSDTLYKDKKNKPTIVSMKKGNSILLIKQSGKVIAFKDASTNTYKAA